MKVLKDLRDSRRKDELITSSGILIHIYDRCDEVKGKVNGKILHQGKKKTSMRLSDGVITRQKSESECHHHVKESRAFGKALTTPYRTLTKVRDKLVSGHSL